MPRNVLESYVARSVTQGIFCQPPDNAIGALNIFNENKRFIRNIGAKLICRAAITWDVPHSPTDYHMADDDYYFETIAKYAAKILAEDPEVILQGTIFETAYSAYASEVADRIALGYSGAGLEQIPIPAWVFEEFDLPVEQRNFSYEDIIYADGTFRNHWLGGASVPDMSRIETKMWFYYRARRYIDAGFESIHFGQVHLMDRNDPDYAHWFEVLTRIRNYASQNARRGFILCDSHTHGIVVQGQHLFDAGLFVLRPKEDCSQQYNATLEFGWIDSIYGKSAGGSTPSGWYCEKLPYNVEFDNSEGSIPGVCGQTQTPWWPWGWDEMTWFAHCSNDYRNQWLEYAVDWLKKNDAIGHLRMPGQITIQTDPIGDIRTYQPNMPNPACPDGFGQEDTIKKLWSLIDAPDLGGITVTQSHYTETDFPWFAADNSDTLQLSLQNSSATVTVSSIAYGRLDCIADSSPAIAGGRGFGFPADNEHFVYGDLDIKLGNNYDLGRTLKDITVFIAPTTDARRFYDLDFSYSTIDDPNTFIRIAKVAAIDDQVIAQGLGSVITISDNATGQISRLDTLRITAGTSRQISSTQYPKHVSSAFIEIDMNMYRKANFNFDSLINTEDLAFFVEKWLTDDQLLPENINQLGPVNFLDFAEFANQWLLHE